MVLNIIIALLVILCVMYIIMERRKHNASRKASAPLRSDERIKWMLDYIEKEKMAERLLNRITHDLFILGQRSINTEKGTVVVTYETGPITKDELSFLYVHANRWLTDNAGRRWKFMFKYTSLPNSDKYFMVKLIGETRFSEYSVKNYGLPRVLEDAVMNVNKNLN